MPSRMPRCGLDANDALDERSRKRANGTVGIDGITMVGDNLLTRRHARVGINNKTDHCAQPAASSAGGQLQLRDHQQLYSSMSKISSSSASTVEVEETDRDLSGA